MKTHILLIDDDVAEMKNFVEALNDVAGDYKCTYSSSGAHALEMLRYLTPQFIFIDYNMPEMNGLELALAIHDRRELKDVPVFVYAAGIDADLEQKAKIAGVRRCLVKPNTIVQLSASLNILFSETAFVFK